MRVTIWLSIVVRESAPDNPMVGIHYTERQARRKVEDIVARVERAKPGDVLLAMVRGRDMDTQVMHLANDDDE